MIKINEGNQADRIPNSERSRRKGIEEAADWVCDGTGVSETGKFLLMKNDSEVERRMLELKSAPAKVRQIMIIGIALGLLMAASFLASAFAGYITWGKAALNGVVHCAIYWLVSGMTMSRNKFGWLALVGLVSIHSWAALGNTMRFVRVIFEKGLVEHGKLLVMDGIGSVRLIAGVLVLALLFSKEFRDYLWKPKPAVD